ncbi:MAG: hypothetical protein QNL01_06195 [Akkermansiaceae bacterium]
MSHISELWGKLTFYWLHQGGYFILLNLQNKVQLDVDQTSRGTI